MTYRKVDTYLSLPDPMGEKWAQSMCNTVVAERWVNEAMCNQYTMPIVKSDDQYWVCIEQS